MELKAPKYLVKSVVPMNQLGTEYGKFATLKSFVVGDMGACISTGTPWHGRTVVQGPAVIFAGEGLLGIRNRLRAWEIEHGVSLADAPLYISSTAARLCDPEFMVEVAAAVAEIAKAVGAPVLIIIDTWSRNIAGDENSSLDSSQAVAALDALRAAYNATVIVVHHEGWGDTGRTRGSTVLMSAVDFAFRCERDANGIMTMSSEKLKDGSPPEPMTFRLKEVDLGIVDEDGEHVTSAVLESIEAPTSASCPKARGKNQRLLLEILKGEVAHNAQNLRDKGLSPTSAKVSWDQWRNGARDAGLDRRRFNEASQALLAAGLVLSDTVFAWPAEPVEPPNPPGTIYPAETLAASTTETAPPETDDSDNSAEFGQSTLNLELPRGAESDNFGQSGKEIAVETLPFTAPKVPTSEPSPEPIDPAIEQARLVLASYDALAPNVREYLEGIVSGAKPLTDPAREIIKLASEARS